MTTHLRACPHCSEEIKALAKVCRYCSSKVTPLYVEDKEINEQINEILELLEDGNNYARVAEILNEKGSLRKTDWDSAKPWSGSEVKAIFERFGMNAYKLKTETPSDNANSNKNNTTTSAPSPAPALTTNKDKFIAALLAIFLGALGLHKFYLDKPSQGIFYLLFFWTFIPAVIGVLDGLKLLFMSQKEFQQIYGTA